MREQSGSLHFKRYIFDEVYGSVGITAVENDIIDTPVYQRLRRILQLGCACLIYPGATHTRFSHSIGTVFIIDRFARSLGLSDRKELQLLRLVALLHDVGHLPFSHTLEDPDGTEDHLTIGKRIIQMNPISRILHKYHIDPEGVVDVLANRPTKRPAPKYSVLIDSDLDVDKVDYLVRDAHHTGVAYGTVDVDRILRTIYFDSEGRLCVEYGSKQALENFLLARYFMYSTVYQHSTVASFGLMMKLMFSELRKRKPSLGPSEALSKGMAHFATYTDDLIMRTMTTYKGKNKLLRELIDMYEHREPLKCVCEQTRLVKQDMSAEYSALQLLRNKESQRHELSNDSKVPEEWIYVEESKPIELVSEEEAAIRVQISDDSVETVPIASDKTSIVSILRGVVRSTLRVYTKEKYRRQLLKCLQDRYFLP